MPQRTLMAQLEVIQPVKVENVLDRLIFFAEILALNRHKC